MTQDYSYSFGSSEPVQKKGFSSVEITQITISVLVLTLAFAIAMVGGYQGLIYNPELFVFILPISAIAVVTAFLFHELAHKFVAQKYDCWAEFRYWKFGLLIALLFSAMGFLFAAPGAVMVSGYITRSQNGKISAAGPISNLGLASALSVTWLLLDPTQDTFWGLIIYVVASINAFIGGFNLIPMMPFDGAKILAWNKVVYGAMAALAVALVLLYFLPG